MNNVDVNIILKKEDTVNNYMSYSLFTVEFSF